MHDRTVDIPAAPAVPAAAGPAEETAARDGQADAQLVMAARSGDRAAFARLYRRYAPVVHAVLLARVSPAEAEDITQDVFVKAMSSLSTLREPASVGPWLLTSARRRAVSMFRRLSRIRLRSLDHEPEPAVKSRAPADDLPSAQQILAIIRSLPEAYRETLLMRLVEGMSGPEIAARTGLTHGSVRVNLTRGMKLLRERMQLEDPT